MARKDAQPGKAEAAAERRVKALQLRIAGAPYRSIGTQLDISEAQAHNDVAHELKRLADEASALAADVRQLELERIDAMTIAIWGQVRAGNLGAIDRALRISERRAKLLGIDAPERKRDEQTPPVDWSRVAEDVQVAFLEGRISLADVIKQLQPR